VEEIHLTCGGSRLKHVDYIMWLLLGPYSDNTSIPVPIQIRFEDCFIQEYRRRSALRVAETKSPSSFQPLTVVGALGDRRRESNMNSEEGITGRRHPLRRENLMRGN
jgi:hypothetical protein